jgi:hypothetical protein
MLVERRRYISKNDSSNNWMKAHDDDARYERKFRVHNMLIIISKRRKV